jgi:hypothetical protein
VVLVTRWPVSGQGVVVLRVGVRMLTAGWAMLVGSADKRSLAAEPPPSGLYPTPLSVSRLTQNSLPWRHPCKSRKRSGAGPTSCGAGPLLSSSSRFTLGGCTLSGTSWDWFRPWWLFWETWAQPCSWLGIILPCRLTWRKVTRPLERRGWRHLLARLDQGRGPGLTGRLCRGWLGRRLRFSW